MEGMSFISMSFTSSRNTEDAVSQPVSLNKFCVRSTGLLHSNWKRHPRTREPRITITNWVLGSQRTFISYARFDSVLSFSSDASVRNHALDDSIYIANLSSPIAEAKSDPHLIFRLCKNLVVAIKRVKNSFFASVLELEHYLLHATTCPTHEKKTTFHTVCILGSNPS